MAEVPAAAREHYRSMLRLQALALTAGRSAWRNIAPNHLGESWGETVRSLSRQVQAVQVAAATAGAAYGAATLAQQGDYAAPEAFVDPAAWGGGYAPDGRDLGGLLYSPITTTKTAIADGATVTAALAAGRSSLETILRTVVADAGRQAAAVDTAARPGVGYVRMLNPPSCSRCTILAGRWYRWNAGFLRHPRCDCVHVQTTLNLQAARYEGLVDDPYEYFRSLPEAEQNRVFGEYDARAIRDGGDINQVVNSRRGRNGLTTSEGTVRRSGNAARSGIARGQRLTPEGIYRQAGSREEALQLLERHGYILPGGQQPGAVLRGPREGFGALGRGGTRVGARTQIEIDRATGTQSRYSMTEAQRRLHDSRQRYDTALAGRNPYGKGPATPAHLAQAENDYRRWLTTGGQIFTR